MNAKYDKCQSDTKGGAMYAEWGKVHTLCKFCSILVEDKPMGGRIESFMNGFDISDETKSMLDARKRRATGIRIWT